jgi:hypothetical protein
MSGQNPSSAIWAALNGLLKRQRTTTNDGHERESAMTAFAKRWRRE